MLAGKRSAIFPSGEVIFTRILHYKQTHVFKSDTVPDAITFSRNCAEVNIRTRLVLNKISGDFFFFFSIYERGGAISKTLVSLQSWEKEMVHRAWLFVIYLFFEMSCSIQ